MGKLVISGNLPVVFFKEGDSFVAHCPVLDLSSCGDTFEDAKTNFEEALDIFFAECAERGTLEKALISCGWTEERVDHQRRISPPTYVGEMSLPVPQLA